MRHCLSMTLGLVLVLGCGSSLTAAPAGDAADTGLAGAVPVDATVLLRLQDPAATIRALQASDLVERLQTTTAWQAWEQGPERRKLDQGITLLRGLTGLGPIELLDRLLGAETLIALRPAVVGRQPDAVLLSRFAGAAELQGRIDGLRQELEARFGFWPFTPSEERAGWQVHAGHRLHYAAADGTLVLATEPGLLGEVLDALAAGGGVGAAAPVDPDVVLGLRLQLDGTQLNRLPTEVDNLVASLLGGHLLAAIHNAEHIDLELRRSGNGLQLNAELPQRGDGLPASHAAFLPPVAADPLTASLAGRADLASIGVQRDWAAWWRGKETFLDAKGLQDLGGLQQVLDLIFTGESFTDDVLTTLAPAMQLVAINQDYEQLQAKPALPAFGMVVATSEPDHIGRRLRGGLQSIAGLITVNRAQQGRDEIILVETERVGEVAIHTLVRDAAGSPTVDQVENNFSASLALVGHRLVVTSTRELARELVEHIQDAGLTGLPPTTGASTRPDRWQLAATGLGQLAAANRDSLIAHQILHEGREHAEAERRTEVLIDLIGFFEGLALTAEQTGPVFRVAVDLQAAAGAPVP